MVSIDHLYYPHLVDLIFEFADPAALAVLAKVCREWRHRVLINFHHIWCLTVEDLGSEEFIILDYPGTFEMVLGKEAIGLLAGCKVLDVGEYDPPPQLVHNASGKPYVLLPNLDTVRYSVACEITLRARQMVFHEGWSPIGEGSPIVERVVVHLDYNMAFCHWSYIDVCSLTALQELIIISESVPLGLWDYNNGGLDIEDLVSDGHDSDSDLEPDDPRSQLRALRCTVEDAVEMGVTVVLVGMEELSLKVFNALELGVNRTYVSGETAFDSRSTLSLMTIDEYRRFVGEKEWAVQTNCDHLTP